MGDGAIRTPGELERPYGWAGTVAELLDLDDDSVLDHLIANATGPVSATQRAAWQTELATLRAAFEQLVSDHAAVGRWGVVLEFELPLENGRRPDVVVLTGRHVLVLEFKSQPSAAACDQAAAYARDLAEYHAGTHGLPVTAAVVLPTAAPDPPASCSADVIAAAGLADWLRGRAELARAEAAATPPPDVRAWVEAPYAPLPTLVAAARRLFRHQPLPRVRAAESAHLPQTVALLQELSRTAAARRRRRLVLLDGVPGSGKTLAGLTLVYSHGPAGSADSVFLSGNGPLVQVLQDAVGSRAFVRDLHAYIRDHGVRGRAPIHHVVVFDEAQRLWDADMVQTKHGLAASEPELLLRIGEQVPDWCVLVGLVGSGQEIYAGEEGGMALWQQALSASTDDWEVWCPPRLAEAFAELDLEVHTDPLLSLDHTLRSRRAVELDRMVEDLLAGRAEFARVRARRVRDAGFPLYITRRLDAAFAYARVRYAGEPDARYGLLCSSHADRYYLRAGFPLDFRHMQRLNRRIAPWFNAPPDAPESCCRLVQPVTEFQCQGLELDLPIVLWGSDLLWSEGSWSPRPKRRRKLVYDPVRLLTNAYRVLLTRGRDGLVIYLPPDEPFDETAELLATIGSVTLVDPAAAGGIAAEERGRFDLRPPNGNGERPNGNGSA